MPLYEYVCENCKKELEVIQKFSDDPLTFCPSCNQESLSKKTSIPAFHLKGGGWYKDGYSISDSNSSSSAKPDSNSAPATEAKTTAAEGAKPAKESPAPAPKEKAPETKAS
ncbi:zinc ribbon domain-containing protein [bacterium]|nr:zinc ribbon domain-containing protein [bacterium]